jgi:CHAT domain-containing protein
VDADALRATALTDLLWSDSAGIAMSRAISSLEMVVRLDTTSAAALADLSAAYLLDAQAHARPEELMYAVDASQRAVAADSENLTARFNAALALEYATLDSQAVLAWAAYLKLDARSGWAKEARRRQSNIRAARAPRRWSTFTMLARGAPEQARAFALDTLLGSWGEATLAGDTIRARAVLDSVVALGEAMGRAGRDGSVRGMARAIGRSRPVDRRRLAAAHITFAKARRQFAAALYPAADSGFERTLALSPPQPLRGWAELGRGLTLSYARRTDEALHSLRAAIGSAPAEDGALAARAKWGIGLTLLRRGAIGPGLAMIREAQHTFTRLGEGENLGAVQDLEAEGLFAAGEILDGFAANHASLATLRRERPTVWRHNALTVLSQQAANEGLARASLVVDNEDDGVVNALGNPLYVFEARLARARALARTGQVAEARVAIEQAREPLRRVASADVRAQLASELGVVSGPLSAAPNVSLATLDTVVAGLAKTRNPTLLMPALAARARASLSLGQVAGAERDLDALAAQYSMFERSVASAPERASVLATARLVMDQIVAVRVRAGDARGALVALERGRTLDRSGTADSLVTSAVSAPTATLDLELVGDTIYAWVLGRGSIHLSQWRVDRSSLAVLVAHTRSALEVRSSAADARAALARLYAVVIQPIEERLPVPGSRLRIVADEELAAVPFSGLLDRRRGSYLVERYALEVDSRLRSGGAQGGGHLPAQATRALFVADPLLDGTPFSSLAPLPGAAMEVAQTSRAYPGAKVMSGAAVDSATLVAAMPRHDVIHFAGHAVFDPRRPERSVLAVAPHGVDGAVVSALDLRRVRLVVLSACETARGADRDGGGFGGLAEAFLNAGAGGVIGSLWSVDDAATAALMSELHRRFTRSGDAAAALRDAQLAALRSNDAARRAPGLWAGFQYAGK